MSRSERRVGEWIIANLASAIDASIQEVADQVGVSQPTVIRFCRSMGTSGFRDLRKHLIAAQQRPDSYSHTDVSQADDAQSSATKVLESSIRALVDLRTVVDSMPFEPAVASMGAARQLIFVGFGASGQVVTDARHKFFRLGLPCSAVVDVQTVRQQSAIAQEGDVFIAVSHTGNWPDLVNAMRIARSKGATVIALTTAQSPLCEVATYVFANRASEDTSVFTPMTSRLAHLTLLDALQVALALEMGESAEENLQRTKLALSPTALFGDESGHM